LISALGVVSTAYLWVVLALFAALPATLLSTFLANF